MLGFQNGLHVSFKISKLRVTRNFLILHKPVSLKSRVVGLPKRPTRSFGVKSHIDEGLLVSKASLEANEAFDHVDPCWHQ